MLKFLSSLIVLLAVATLVVLFSTTGKTPYWQMIGEKNETKQAENWKIGGDFTLTDQNGNQLRSESLRGRVLLVFFGFTRCPDVCPITSGILARTLALLGDKADAVAAVFITVDPEHDTPQVIKEYLANFDSRIIGLTGSKEQIKQVADAYKAYFASDDAGQENAHDGHGHMEATPPADEGRALTEKANSIEHSGFIYLMDKNGEYSKHFPYNASAEELAQAASQLLEK